MTATVIDLHTFAARREAPKPTRECADHSELQARIDLAHWVELYGDLGAPFLLDALKNATSAVEAFHDMMKERNDE